MRKALVRQTDGLVVNVIVADDDWMAPEGYIVVDAEGQAVGPGDTWNGMQFLRRVPSAEEVAEAAEVAAIESTLLSIGRAALANWASLTASQKYDVLRGLLRYTLHKERR